MIVITDVPIAERNEPPEPRVGRGVTTATPPVRLALPGRTLLLVAGMPGRASPRCSRACPPPTGWSCSTPRPSAPRSARWPAACPTALQRPVVHLLHRSAVVAAAVSATPDRRRAPAGHPAGHPRRGGSPRRCHPAGGAPAVAAGGRGGGPACAARARPGGAGGFVLRPRPARRAHRRRAARRSAARVAQRHGARSSFRSRRATAGHRRGRSVTRASPGGTGVRAAPRGAPVGL